MRIRAFGLAGCVAMGLAASVNARLVAQDATGAPVAGETSRLIVGHPFAATKYARRVKVFPDGKWQFVRNERYPTQIARDADGRVMMQKTHSSDDLPPECNRMEMLVPPPCPAWGIVVIDPVAHTVTHWGEGELADHAAVQFPLTPERLEEVADSTALMPVLGPNFSEEDGKFTKIDLGEKEIEGVPAHGVRWTLRYEANQDGNVVQRTRIHEVWTSEEMQLVVRVIDGDPNGEETVWGLEKISLAPDAALFRPPEGYGITHRQYSERWAAGDSRTLKRWFEK